MTDIQADIMEIKQTLKQMQQDINTIKKINADYFDWNSDIYQDVPPYIPTQGCSLEDQMNAIKKYDEYCERHPEFIGGMVKGE